LLFTPRPPTPTLFPYTTLFRSPSAGTKLLQAAFDLVRSRGKLDQRRNRFTLRSVPGRPGITSFEPLPSCRGLLCGLLSPFQLALEAPELRLPARQLVVGLDRR